MRRDTAGMVVAMSNHAAMRAVLTLLPGVVALCLGGCSLNGGGAIAARIDRADGALVYTTYAPGLSLRTRAEERGAVLGFSTRTCIAALDARAPAGGLYLGRLPSYPARCYARHLTSWGAELRTSVPDLSFSVGFRDSAFLARTPVGDTVSYELDYDTTRPSHAHLEVHTQ